MSDPKELVVTESQTVRVPDNAVGASITLIDEAAETQGSVGLVVGEERVTQEAPTVVPGGVWFVTVLGWGCGDYPLEVPR